MKKDRPPGNLMVISSREGTVLAKAEMPDGKETYMSPVVYDFEDNGDISVLFGTGGETINGNFYKTRLEDILAEDLSKAKKLAGGHGKGFIAPPVLTDVTGDEIKDIIVNSVNGKVFCIDGSDELIIWKADLGDTFEGYTSPSPGNFNSDSTTDFFVSYGHGIWPNIDFAYQAVLDGRDGSVIFEDTAGTFQYASPLTSDFNGDGRDEALVVINNKEDKEVGLATLQIYVNEMVIYDPHNRNSYRLHEKKNGSNLGSTPLLTDLDRDGYLDIIYCYMDDAFNYYSFKLLKIERIEMDIRFDIAVKWGEYMGPGHDGVHEE